MLNPSQTKATEKQQLHDNIDLVSDKAKGPSVSTIRRSILGLTKKARTLQSVRKLTQPITGFFQVSLLCSLCLFFSLFLNFDLS
jgi:hypothetical protein